MNTKRISEFDDATLRRELSAVAARSRDGTAELLAHLAEFDARELYRADGCPSMFTYCVEVLHFSEGAAYKRIHAARAARRFPRLFGDVATGRLHLAAICLLAPHRKPENLDEFVAAAVHRSKAEVESWLAMSRAVARPAPRASVTLIGVAPSTPVGAEATLFGASGTAGIEAPPGESTIQLPPGAVETSPAVDMSPAIDARPEPIYLVRIPIDGETQVLLREVQALLGQSVAPGDLSSVFRRALEGLRESLLRRKAAEVGRPREPHVRATDSRTIPAHARREVWARDGGRCTFTSAEGRRCSERRGLEFDHVLPYARGGRAESSNLRLRCRPHNQLEAELVFGAEFMESKRVGGA